MNAVENYLPHYNWDLYGRELARKLPPKQADALKKIEMLKNKICEKAQIPQEVVSIRLQERGIVENHGNSNQAVLGISLQLLASYQPIDPPNQPLTAPITSRNRFREFIQSLPDHPDELISTIKKLPAKDLQDYLSLAKNYALDLNEEEMKFVLSHEIRGHIRSNDAAQTNSYSNLLGWGTFSIAELANAYLPFTYSKFVWHSIFYSIRWISLSKAINCKQEKLADIAALELPENIPGGIHYFKRLLAINLLYKYTPFEIGTPEHAYQFLSDSNGESFFRLNYETTKARLLRCWQAAHIPIKS